MNHKEEKLKMELLKNSSSDIYQDAIGEWKGVGVKRGVGGTCICSQRISHLFYIKNIITNKVLIVGSTCINKFGSYVLDEFVREIKERWKSKDKMEKLRNLQKINGVPPSLTGGQLGRYYRNQTINNWEYDFYMDILLKTNLTSGLSPEKISGTSRK